MYPEEYPEELTETDSLIKNNAVQVGWLADIIVNAFDWFNSNITAVKGQEAAFL